MSNLDRRIAYLRENVKEISPAEAHTQLADNEGIVVDVRESEELESGMVVGAVHLPKSTLELRAEKQLGSLERNIYLICGSGVRSLLAADSLTQLGFKNLISIRGGMAAWKDSGLPTERPKLLNSDDRRRYSRHLLIPEVGETGQLKLLKGKVLLVGAGGLGSPCAQYLAAAGVGTIGLIDHDVVEVSNLQRQVIHGMSSLGKKKVDSAKARMLDINPNITIDTYNEMLDESNVDDLFSRYDVIVDGCDNFQTRYLINDACVKHKRPNVHGAVFRFEGYVTVFDATSGGPCYRCLYPAPPPAEMAPSCMEAGVLGVVPGVIGLLQAVETVKLLLEIGQPLVGKILRYDALESEFTELDVAASETCLVCSSEAGDINFQHYGAQCSTAS